MPDSIVGHALLVCGALLSAGAWGGAGTPEPVRVLEAHGDNVYGVTVDRPGTRLLTASADNTAKVWDLKTGRVLRTLEHKAPVYAAAFSPDGGSIATCAGDGQVALWEAARGERLRVLAGHAAPVYSLAFSPDGTRLASGSGEPENECLLWEVATGRLLARGRGHQRPIYGVAFSPHWLATSSSDKTIRLWPWPGLENPRVLAGHTSDVYRCEFSPDGTLLASVSQDKTVRLWDVASGTARFVLSGHRDPVYGLAFSPGGDMLASVGDDRTLRLWDTRSGQVRSVWKDAHHDAIYTVAFGGEGVLISAGAEGKVAFRRVLP